MSGYDKTSQTPPDSPAYPNGGPDKTVPAAANPAPNTAGGSRDDKHLDQGPSSEPLARLPNNSTDPDKGIPGVNNPASDPTSSNGGDDCPNQGLPSGSPVESPADDKSAKDDQVLGNFIRIDVNAIPGKSMSPEEFFGRLNDE
ncbi:hypothetical protein VTG60DRAFT_7357 [Thermothelomyces hinnuleus]